MLPITDKLHTRAGEILRRTFDHLRGIGCAVRSDSFITNDGKGVLVYSFIVSTEGTPEQKQEELHSLAKGPHKKLLRDVKKMLKKSYEGRIANA